MRGPHQKAAITARHRLGDLCLLSEDVESILGDVKSEIEQGVAFALAAPFPKPKQVTEDVYA